MTESTNDREPTFDEKLNFLLTKVQSHDQALAAQQANLYDIMRALAGIIDVINTTAQKADLLTNREQRRAGKQTILTPKGLHVVPAVGMSDD